jgi:cell division protease FtsH
MFAKQWLDRGTMLPDGSKTINLVAFSEEWQISITSYDGFVLAAKPQLYEKWVVAGLIPESVFELVTACDAEYRVFTSKHGYMISSIESGPYPNTSVEARAFAVALRETRKIACTVSLHDALYIEQISRLLPTYTVTESFDDQTVLGTWLSAGVSISVKSFRRFCKLLEWMDAKEVDNILEDAGFSAPCGIYITKTRAKEVIKADCLEGKPSADGGLLPDAKFLLPSRPYLENFFNEHVVEIIAHEEEYKRMGIDFPSAIVLHGPPGCGKTYAVDRLVEFLDWPSYPIDSGSIGSPYIHDTSKKISEVFDKAIDNAPSIIVIDEMEAFLIDRSVGQASGTHHVEEVAEFLRRIPEAAKKRVLVIAMTNMLDSIDPAILRRGRFDHIIEVNMPSAEEVRLLLTNLLSKLPLMDDVNIEDAADKLQGRPVSDVAYAVKEAGRMAVKLGKKAIDNDILASSISILPPVKKSARKIGFNAE